MGRSSIKFTVRLTELPGKPETLTFHDDVPNELLTATPTDPKLRALYANECRRLIALHYSEIEAGSITTCIECNGPRHTILQTPMSYLHLPEPFIMCYSMPVCRNGKCEYEARKSINETLMGTMDEYATEYHVPGPSSASREVLPCGNCNKVGQVKKCGRCELVAYCDKECQTAHWKVHKRICAPRK